jgi:hypothetical protein
LYKKAGSLLEEGSFFAGDAKILVEYAEGSGRAWRGNTWANTAISLAGSAELFVVD